MQHAKMFSYKHLQEQFNSINLLTCFTTAENQLQASTGDNRETKDVTRYNREFMKDIILKTK
jgi:hypothetical protein